MRHPFEDSPQWSQQYESPEIGAWGGNGLGKCPDEDWQDPSTPSAEEEYLEAEEINPLDVLTAKQRFVIELRFGLRDGHSHTQREVAELMGVTKRAVAKHEQAAKKKLNRVLKTGTQEPS